MDAEVIERLYPSIAWDREGLVPAWDFVNRFSRQHRYTPDGGGGSNHALCGARIRWMYCSSGDSTRCERCDEIARKKARTDPRVLRVCRKRCDQCLFSSARIVDEERAEQVVADCLETGTHFICHKATVRDGGNVCCRGFYDRHGDDSLVIRLAREFDVVVEVDP